MNDEQQTQFAQFTPSATLIRDNMWSIATEAENSAIVFCVPASVKTADEVLDLYAVAVASLSEPQPATVSDYEDAIQVHIDGAARSKLFRDGGTLASYVASTNPQWSAEAQAFVAWRDQVWAYAYQELARVVAGDREQPTVEEILTELPEIVWP
ncbi:MAG: hypothetical protein ACK4Z3_00395 [Rhizobium rosettiformans]